MKTKFQTLIQWLKQANLPEEADEIEDLSEYAEPWHQDAVEEFPETYERPDSDYLDQVHPIKPEQLKTKFYTDSVDEDNKRRQIMQIVAQENFRILDPGSQDMVAGQGGYGVVLRGIYRGKPAVAKIVLGGDGRAEVENWKTIQQAGQYDPKIQKHLPIIYKLNAQTLTYKRQFRTDQIKYGIIIMEELQPLNQQFRQIISGGEMLELAILKDEDYLWKFAQDLAQFLDDQEGISIDPTVIFQWLYQIDFANLHQNMERDEIIEVVGNYLDTKLKQAGHHVHTFYLMEFVYQKLVHSYFPSSYGNEKALELFKQLPETAGYANALTTLLKDFKLGWDDVRHCNMMMGFDGNLKLIDPGVYQRISKGQ